MRYVSCIYSWARKRKKERGERVVDSCNHSLSPISHLSLSLSLSLSLIFSADQLQLLLHMLLIVVSCCYLLLFVIVCSTRLFAIDLLVVVCLGWNLYGYLWLFVCFVCCLNCWTSIYAGLMYSASIQSWQEEQS